MSLLFLKFKVKTFSQLKTSLSFFIGADIMIYGPVDDHKNLDKASAWMSLHNQIVEKFKSKMSVVAKKECLFDTSNSKVARGRLSKKQKIELDNSV